MNELQTHSYEKLILLSLGLLTAIGSIYSYKLMSFLLPILTFSAIWLEGGIKKISFQISPPLVLFLLLLIWIGMSVFWAQNQEATLKTFISTSLTFFCSLFLFGCLIKASPKLIEKAYDIVKFSGIFLIFFILFQIYFDTFFNGMIQYTDLDSYMLRMKPTGSIIGLTAFVSCGFIGIYENKTFAILTFLLLFCLILLTLCQTAFYGIVLGTIVFLLSYLMPFWITRLGMIGSYTFLIISPSLYVYILPPHLIATSPYFKWVMNHNFFHRILGWEYYGKKFFEKPWVGWGAESSRFLPTDRELAPGFTHLVHPHNNSIQAYVELGIVGGILYALFFSSLFYLVEKNVKDRLSIAICNATITFGFVGAIITHNAWRNYWLSLVALTTGLIILFIKARAAQLHVQAGHSTPVLAPQTE